MASAGTSPEYVWVDYTHGMSVRLQVLLDEDEMGEVRAIAERHGLTVSDWIRQVVRAARRREAVGDPARKLAAVRAAMQHSFPTGDIEQMLEETERGYLVAGAFPGDDDPGDDDA